MYLIADSGSTKADWALIPPGKPALYTHTMGLNPYFHGPDKVQSVLSDPEFRTLIPTEDVTHLFFYGAGIPDDHYRSIMTEGLRRVFPKATIEVEHDLLGAARAGCGRNPGIAGILGTGSNSCAYDGTRVTDNVTALGHVLGDDGGGVHLGKLILQAHFYRELPDDLEREFNREYPEGNDAIIHRIYGEGQNVHIARFAQFLIARKSHPYAKSLIHQAFREFSNRHLKKYNNWQNTPVHLIGSIADLLRDDLKAVLDAEGLQLGSIIRKPIEPLVKYHLEG
jgi:N-acetylglucosamine kinase-like BadF-type ATPase